MDEDQERNIMNNVGNLISDTAPKGSAFFAFVAFPDGNSTKKARYVSNMDRKDALDCMKEFLVRNKYKEDWMQHLE